LKNKIIVVEIKGGFGNQLFQFSFANSLREMGYKVKVKTNFYEQFENDNNYENTYRKLILPETLFGFKKTNKITNKFLFWAHKFNESKKINTIFGKRNNSFFIKLKDSDYSLDKMNKKVIHLDGYWQNIDSIISNKKYLIESISKNLIIKEGFNNSPKSSSVMLNVRRNDYLEMNEELNNNFYQKSINYIESKINDMELNIFTDDLSWVQNNDIFSFAQNVYGPEDESDKVIELFSKMIQQKHFIIGNSTFSLIAAALSEQDDSVIIIASPWFRHKDKKNLSKVNWIQIENK
tara:strand:- start:369 stop:1244 length:876 start_codon:yes stop_codon:yes gene_type:complete